MSATVLALQDQLPKARIVYWCVAILCSGNANFHVVVDRISSAPGVGKVGNMACVQSFANLRLVNNFV